MTTLSENELGITGFRYPDLYAPERLAELLIRFDDALRDEDPELFEAYRAWRAADGANLDPVGCSDLLVRVAPYVGAFIARLIGVEQERAQAMAAVQRDMAAIFDFKRAVVDRAGARFRNENVADWDLDALDRDLDLLKRAAFPKPPRIRMTNAPPRWSAPDWRRWASTTRRSPRASPGPAHRPTPRSRPCVPR